LGDEKVLTVSSPCLSFTVSRRSTNLQKASITVLLEQYTQRHRPCERWSLAATSGKNFGSLKRCEFSLGEGRRRRICRKGSWQNRRARTSYAKAQFV
jgi:hypothetical protein